MSDVGGINKEGQVLAKLGESLLDLSGFELDELDMAASFLELGFDSLFLIQFSQAIKRDFQVDISFRELIEGVPNLPALVTHIAAEVPEGVLPTESPASVSAPNPSAPQAPAVTPPSMTPPSVAVPPMPVFERGQMPVLDPASADSLEAIMAQQLQVMSMQIAMLTGQPIPGQPMSEPVVPTVDAVATDAPTAEAPVVEPAAEEDTGDTFAPQTSKEMKPFGAIARINLGQGDELTEAQQEWLADFIQRYNAMTAKSKSYMAEHHAHHADPRVVSGFSLKMKELIYPIVTERTEGSRIWDIDGNEFVDALNGFGSNFFGYANPRITQAVVDQMWKGVEIGPQSPDVGEAAKAICEFTRMDRAGFCNTGSEAVMGAMRIARTVTGRRLIATFNGSYHGIFDEVIVRPTGRKNMPAAPGIMPSSVENLLVLEYGDPKSLEILRERAHELAAIMVEPVQSRRPELQPREFVKELREITRESGSALIFDEVITGFRMAPGGAQDFYDVEADIGTYGKVIGGGMQIGVVAGKSKWMDALDGGPWQFGDDSQPEVGVTYFAGTFVRHPASIAACKAALEILTEEGPELQERVNAKTTYLASELNSFFESQEVPLEVNHFSSLWRMTFTETLPYSDVLFYLIREKGVHIYGGFPAFLSIAHTDEDVEIIVNAVKDSVRELQDAGFLPRSAAAMAEAEFFRTSGLGEGHFPLTDSQADIWLASQMEPQASWAYNEPFMVRLDGNLDLNRLQQAVDIVLPRHEGLYMRFSPEGDYQYRGNLEPVEIPVTGLSAGDGEAYEAELAAAYARVGSDEFDLTTGPLFRIEALKLPTVLDGQAGDPAHILLVSCHHIVGDGWSWNLILQELGHVYTSLGDGSPYDLDKPFGFSRYVLAEAAGADTEAAEAAYDYWREQFADLPPALELPTDRARPAVKTFSGGTVTHRFDPDVYEGVKQAAASQRASLFSTLFAGFNLLLSRLSGQNDIVMTVPSAGQLKVGESNLVGHCVNLLPVRTKLDPAGSFSDFLRATSTSVLDAYDNQDATLGGIVRRLDIPRNASRMPLTEINFNVDRDDAGVSFGDLDVEVSHTPKEAVVFDIFFNINETREGLKVDCDFNTDLYDHETIERWIRYFETLLRSIVDNPDGELATLEFLPEHDRQLLTSTWNDTATDFPDDRAVHELFMDQVERTPDSTAVVFGDVNYSYRELDERSNQLANYLISHDVGVEDVVGLYVERSAEMLVALLAIMKAGAAYVPMDPAYPAQRINYMVNDAGMSYVITTDALVSSLGELASPVIRLDADRDLIAAASTWAPRVDVEPDGLVYIIYTSGSTGVPKGVLAEHRALTNQIWDLARRPGVTADDVMLAATSVSFDPAGVELYTPLIVGGTVAIVSQDVVTDGFALAQAISDLGVTVAQATPTSWRMLVESGWTGSPNLTMMTGGEPLTEDLAEQLLSRGRQLWNVYGPTETTVWSSLEHVVSADQGITVGLPLANVTMHILDDSGELVPTGTVGAIFIGGVGVARGYLNRDDLTNEMFVPDPFSDQPGARMYNSGDLGRRLSDGRIECLGRQDSQVKIRGYRIELGEIEAQLGSHPAITRSAVTVREDTPGDKQLAAYYVLGPPESADSNGANGLSTNGSVKPTWPELRQYLGERLPDYMVPAVAVQLEHLPRTPSGKVDRKALPVPDDQRTGVETSYVPPSTPTEREVAEIWQSVMGLEEIGVHDNFFDLGGHSLQATRIMARVRSGMGVDVKLREMYAAPTVSALALAVTEMMAAETDDAELEALLAEIENMSDSDS